MKYGNMAKLYQYHRGADAQPAREDAQWLTGGEKKKFADGQFDKFMAALDAHRESIKSKLVKKGILQS